MKLSRILIVMGIINGLLGFLGFNKEAVNGQTKTKETKNIKAVPLVTQLETFKELGFILI